MVLSYANLYNSLPAAERPQLVYVTGDASLDQHEILNDGDIPRASASSYTGSVLIGGGGTQSHADRYISAISDGNDRSIFCDKTKLLMPYLAEQGVKAANSGKYSVERSLYTLSNYLNKATVSVFQIIEILLPYHLNQSKELSNMARLSLLFNKFDSSKLGQINKSMFMKNIIHYIVIPNIEISRDRRGDESEDEAAYNEVYELKQTAILKEIEKVFDKVISKFSLLFMDFIAFQDCLHVLVSMQLIDLTFKYI